MDLSAQSEVALGTSSSLNPACCLHYLHRRGKLLAVLKRAIGDEIVSRYAREHSIVVEENDLQQAADRFRLTNGLSSAQRTQAWLKKRGQSVIAWEASLEFELLREKVIDHVTCESVPRVFARHRESFAVAVLEQIIVHRADAAAELRAQVEEGAEFATLGRPVRGYLKPRRHFRRALPSEVAEDVFRRQPGEIAGPFSTARGYCLVRVCEIHPPALDQATTAWIRDRLFRKWLAKEFRRENVRFPLLDALNGHESA